MSWARGFLRRHILLHPPPPSGNNNSATRVTGSRLEVRVLENDRSEAIQVVLFSRSSKNLTAAPRCFTPLCYIATGNYFAKSIANLHFTLLMANNHHNSRKIKDDAKSATSMPLKFPIRICPKKPSSTSTVCSNVWIHFVHSFMTKPQDAHAYKLHSMLPSCSLRVPLRTTQEAVKQIFRLFFIFTQPADIGLFSEHLEIKKTSNHQQEAVKNDCLRRALWTKCMMFSHHWSRTKL